MSIAFFPIFLTLVNATVLLSVPVIIGVYVWRDARRRGMSAPLWTAVSVLVPALIGFVVYLLVRTNHSDLQCAVCSAHVEETYIVCPGCGTKLRASCPSCSTAVEHEWKVCPRCAGALPQSDDDVTAPIHPKDKALKRIVALVIIIPILVLTVLVASLSAYFAVGSSSVTKVSVEEYANIQEDPETAEKVRSWLGGLPDETGRAYALRYDRATETDSESFFLVYIPGAGTSSEIGFGQSSTVFGTTLKLEAERTGDSGTLFCLTSSADTPPNLSVTLDGRRIPCEVTEVDFNPTTYYIMPEYAQSGAPGGDDALPLPNRVTVEKVVDGISAETREVVEEDLIIDILTLIDTADILDIDDPLYETLDDPRGFEPEGGFVITVDYVLESGVEASTRYRVFEHAGARYLIDASLPEDGGFAAQIEEEFDVDLDGLFE